MGEYGVYRKQFYTKLFSSCHVMSFVLMYAAFIEDM